MRTLSIVILSLLVNATLVAEEYVVEQENLQFNRSHLTIKSGDSLKFTNQDAVFHNIFSLSKLKTFDLGFFNGGKSKSVKFTTPGKYFIECAIHPHMTLDLKVE